MPLALVVLNFLYPHSPGCSKGGCLEMLMDCIELLREMFTCIEGMNWRSTGLLHSDAMADSFGAVLSDNYNLS